MPGVLDATSPTSSPRSSTNQPLEMLLTDTAISDYLSAVFSADSSQGSLDAALALCSAILSDPATAHHSFPTLFPPLAKAASDKKSGTRRESAMIVYGALYESFIPKSPITEVLLLKETLPIVLDGLADKGAVVREASQYAIDAMLALLKEEALVVGLVRVLMAYVKGSGSKWQGRVAALQLIGRIAEKAVTRDGFLKEVMGRELETLIPVVEGGMHDLKNEVSRTAVKAMTSLAKLLSNDDVARHIPTLIKTMSDPSKETLQKAIHDLSQTTFIAVVTSPVLSLLTPLLERSLSSPQTSQDVLRQTVVVVENLTKLVHDPVEAREFLPRLQPGVKKIEGTAALPVVRSLAKDANATMVKAMKVGTGTDVPERISVDEFKRIPGCTTVYLEHFMAQDDAKRVAAEIEQWARDETLNRFGNGIGEVDDEHKDEVEIVNAEFSLAYGGMMLLTHTNLRLFQGHRYGLCGRNGAGKSTLMRSISQGKLEGFPSKDELRTCFVEHKERDERDMSIVGYIRLALEENGDGNISDEEIVETLKSVGFEGERAEMNIGQLSGGWKMKLGLAEAMLKRAQVLLLDEPTNHLDVSNVQWLQDYLKLHTEITSLIVSHDSKFLDEVCTDIIHYENKKLVYYKGNLSEFVRKRPEGKAYYSLDASNVSFKFPSPGLLTGVKSATRSIIKMTNVTYTYPTATRPSLYNVTTSLSLSSRVAIIGGNGAGKSTLVKLLTGEMVPQEGRVEKHPNLRVGYMAQQSLHHLVQDFDDAESAREGLGYRDLDVASIEKHFEDIGLDKEIAMNNEIGGLSGGQKVKVVIAAAMWPKPHLLILDEPTNYLDRESLGALATAIKEFRGGVCMISHDAQFVSQLSNEEWHIEAGRMVRKTSNGSNMNLSLPLDLNSRPGSSAVSLASSTVSSAANTDAEDNNGEGMEFKSIKRGKKKKYTRAQLKEREVRRRLRYLEWLNSPKGTPKPADTDDES
ncbi:P-loop containing nucleoside triphosphate hydrolase protein [Tuber indicum]|nr:P-loop containing nucleoside triphosphate hydrolase protein [Tuber indicum]